MTPAGVLRSAGGWARPTVAATPTAIALAEAHSPFLRGILHRRPEIAPDLAAQGLAAVLDKAAQASAAEPDAALALRRERQVVALAVALADLAGAPFEMVTRALSDFADRALDRPRCGERRLPVRVDCVGDREESVFPDADDSGRDGRHPAD